ncbi:hypothetical protein LJC56_05010 [Christensenellaceae bacterium OttesenSCG-928-K19]|nr:hypothetical protein [Christensenellaceae bacterium OttesenSCG-928-K19]
MNEKTDIVVVTKTTKVFVVVFLVLLFVISVANFVVARPNVKAAIEDSEYRFTKESINKVEAAYDANVYKKQEWISLYGGAQRVMLKYEVGNFDVVKDEEGFLHLTELITLKSEEELIAHAENLHQVYEYALASGSEFLYVQAPADVVEGKTVFPVGMDDYYPINDILDSFLGHVENENIPYIDTRKLYTDFSLEEIFYKTDHHWAFPACFRAYQEIIDVLNTEYDMNLDTEYIYRDINNYKALTYPQSMLGSTGVRVGPLYTGKDDVIVYIPNYETNFTTINYDGKNNHIDRKVNWERSGSFAEAFISFTLLDNPHYSNKYNAFMHATGTEARIKNHRSNNDTKCLIIADSFMRQMLPYLSQCFSETAWIDGRAYRYRGSVADYIDEFDPDIVIVMTHGDGVYSNVMLEGY